MSDDSLVLFTPYQLIEPMQSSTIRHGMKCMEVMQVNYYVHGMMIIKAWRKSLHTIPTSVTFRDKLFERLIKSEKGKSTHRTGELNKRHCAALELLEKVPAAVADLGWFLGLHGTPFWS